MAKVFEDSCEHQDVPGIATVRVKVDRVAQSVTGGIWITRTTGPWVGDTETQLQPEGKRPDGHLLPRPGGRGYPDIMSSLAIDIPEATLVALRLDASRAGAELRLAAAMKLYELGRLSSGAPRNRGLGTTRVTRCTA